MMASAFLVTVTTLSTYSVMTFTFASACWTLTSATFSTTVAFSLSHRAWTRPEPLASPLR